MYIEELLKNILELLPQNIKDNLISKNLEENLINLLESNMDCEFILNEDIYNKLNINDISVNKFPKNERNFIIELHLIGNNKITYTIANFNVKTNIELTILTTEEDRFIETTIHLQINNENKHSELITQVTEKDNYDYYYNYDYHIYRYDSKYKELTENIDEDIDSNFIEIFHTPRENTRMYRNNFKMYSKYLNMGKVRYEMQESDKEYTKNNLDEDSTYVFDGTYYGVEDLKDNLKEELLENDYIDDDVLEKIDDILDRIFDAIKEKYKDNLIHIDEDTMFIWSFNLYDNIYKYSINKSNDTIYTSGIIIFKEDNEYLLCKLKISNNKIDIDFIEMSHNDIKTLIKYTEIEEDDEDLKDFFNYGNGYGRNRK